ncbi:MAG: isochorismatase family protein [Candidatus Accumulibacter sp.]|uniref:cysteine hydrolase family protein n=1 Tax=Accumulibacter sp. TaxID=2053492 RepID=UPI0025E0E1FC|nr:isochorismatase family protein [Accumulibacter sp.]MCP5249250.1 isochorismatase family protein [Accumulibacter sp.]
MSANDLPDAAPRQRSALIVIDVQESFRQMPFWSETDVPAFKAALLRLEKTCRARGVPVVHIFHVGQAGPFTEESGAVRGVDWLPGSPDVCFFKHTHNAFSDTGLDLWLRRRGIERLIITGIRSEQCCETTARVASDIGYQVDFVSEATLTFPMEHPLSGRVYSPEEIKAHTELVLAGRFARIVSVDDCLAALGEGNA